MSRIFDALQRSGAEQSGVEYPDMVSIATAVFEAPSKPEAAEDTQLPAAPASLPDDQPVPPQEVTPKVPATERALPLLSFPSIEINVTPASRLVFLTQSESLAAEKFRFLGVRLRQIRQTRPVKKILITSTIPGEGKSLVSANLAGVLARRKEKVLLIEGDLRRPVLGEQLGLGTLAGLAEWLQSGNQTPSNIYHLIGPEFWFMPAGQPPANALELMQSGRLSALLRQIADAFDWIVIDSPPLLPLADTTVWARLTDGTLLVTREGATKKAPLERGIEAIKKSDLLGVILNSCSDTDHSDYYHRYVPQAAK
jgi:capsular exopolysaccharide synthesis family protein